MTLIATCPVCVGETHEAIRVYGYLVTGCSKCPQWLVIAITDCGAQAGPLVARIDGGDPGDEDQEVRR